jgi:tRNA pseudouridine55 synthase
MNGIIIIDKPRGLTSHDVVHIVRRISGVKKVGHLGTLDPAATGVLPLALGKATKSASKLSIKDKTYEFTLRLGISTTTDDDEGDVIDERPLPADFREELQSLLSTYTGDIMQRPPNYSAIKVNGRRAYELARKGIEFTLEERPTRVDSLEILELSGSEVRMRMSCGAGTYVRSICRDLGEDLKCGGHAKNIRRTMHGNYSIDKAIELSAIKESPELIAENLLPM